jgi:hypothetical protein
LGLLDSLNTKEIAHDVINKMRAQLIKSRPNMKENIDTAVWKEKIRIVHHSLREKVKKVWESMVGGWAIDLNNARDPDDSGMLRDVRETTHMDIPCYLISSGEMNDTELLRNHISRKIIDSSLYKILKQSPNFIIDPLNAWGMRTENIKVQKARKKYSDFKANNREEEFLDSESLKDIVNFFALDKYDLSSVLVERGTCKPHIINKDRAARVVFESYDGAYIQIEQEMELLVFLWDKKKREDYFYREVGKFREGAKMLFKGIISHLMRMRSNPLRFIPRDPAVLKTGEKAKSSET